MSDIHDNRVTVTLGGDKFELVASKLAERIYGDRFRNDVSTLGTSGVIRQERDKDNNPIGEPYEVAYSGRLKLDVAISSACNVSGGEIPRQVVAATWALAKAAGSTDMTYDEFDAWWLSLPSNAQEDLDLFEAVCVDLSERAFFRDVRGQSDAAEPNEIEQATRADEANG